MARMEAKTAEGPGATVGDGPAAGDIDAEGLPRERAASGTAGAIKGEACSRVPSNDRARGGAGAATVGEGVKFMGEVKGGAGIDANTLPDKADAMGAVGVLVAPSPARGV